jgi:flavin-dependent dehydrogenase
MAVERDKLDAHLVEQAGAAGVTFLDRSSARVMQSDVDRAVVVEREGVRRTLQARWVLACDGINGSSLSDQSWAGWSIAPNSRIGAAITMKSNELPAGEIHMRVGAGGYVGQVRIDNDTVHVAAAFDADACRAAGSPGHLAAAILDRPAMAEKRWTGIGRLTRHRKQLAAPGVLAVGDACGYVEPFTGQGIAWAIAGAIEATSLLLSGIDDAAVVEQWNERYARTVGRSQRTCHAVRYSLQHPAIGSTAAAALSLWPGAWGRFNSWMS